MANILLADLVEYGLSEREAKVYLVLLELETAGINQIATKSKIGRSSVYGLVESLQKRGLVSEEADASDRQIFYVVPPDSFIKEARERITEKRSNLNKLSTVVTHLKDLHKQTRYVPKVRIFEGTDGIMSVMNEVLEASDKTLRTFTSGELLLSFVPEEMVEWSIQRRNRGFEIFCVFVDNAATRALIDMAPEGTTSVFVPQDNYPFPVDAVIWDNKVGYLLAENNIPTTIVIEAKEISTITKNMFDMAFKRARATGGDYVEK